MSFQKFIQKLFTNLKIIILVHPIFKRMKPLALYEITQTLPVLVESITKHFNVHKGNYGVQIYSKFLYIDHNV